jgi:hypothetical protein
MRAMRRLAILLPICVIALAGCGSSDLNKAQLASKVNSICSSFVTQGRQVPVPPDFTTNSRAAAAYLDKVISLTDNAYSKIKGLGADSSVKSDFNAYLNAVAHDISLLKSAASKAHAKDRTGLVTLQQETAYDRAITRPLATKLGFTRCNG